MKKYISIIFLLILLFPILSAINIEMKDEYKRGETFLAKFSGNFITPPSEENIFFYRGHVKIPGEIFLAKIDDEFYVSSQLLNKEAGNYSIVIEEVEYMYGVETSEEDIIGNFTILSELADFKVDPGLLITNEDFYVNLQNLQDSKLNISLSLETDSGSSSDSLFSSFFGTTIEESEGKTFELKSGEIEKINFEISDIKSSTLKKLRFSTTDFEYELPVYVYLNDTENRGSSNGISNYYLEFEPSELDVSSSTGYETSRIVYLENSGEGDTEDIEFSVSNSLEDFVNISPHRVDKLESNSSLRIEIYISSDNPYLVKGHLKAETFDDVFYLPISLNFTEGYIPNENISDTEDKYCAELNGELCGESEECVGVTKTAVDGDCCLGTCEENPSGTGSGGFLSNKVIGWGLLILVVAFLGWFYFKKYRGQSGKKEVDLLKFGKK